jgi:CRP-like cAMP-binding protein
MLDVGSELELDEGTVVVDPESPASGIFLVLHGVLRVETEHETSERGPGQIVGEWEKLDGSESVRMTAQTEVRLVAVDRAAYEAALTG